MLIIEQAALENGAHRNQTTSSPIPIPDGWAVIPDEMETPNFPFGDIEVAEIDGVMTVTSWTPGTIPEPEPDTLAENKTARIQQSKDDLETYLAEHPIQWTDGEYYAITQKKQNQLTSKILSATLAAQTSTAYTLTWNSTGEVCKEWTLQDLSALAFAIDARVTALVTYQQTKEVEIRNTTTQEELDAIVVDYDTVL